MRLPPILASLALLASCGAPSTTTDDDPDGDGIPTALELAGMTIVVDETGYIDQRVERVVVSDPVRADTDGDGLDDAQERANRTDPTRADTDGDGLTDLEEIERWQTSPTSVDSDGDAARPDGGPPLADLFDGAELQLTADGDAGPDATSPLLVDTDGDGATDFDEWLSPTRAGHIVERPEFRFEITPGTDVELAMNVRWGESLENSEAYEVEFSEDSGSSWSMGSTFSTAMSTWYTQTAYVFGGLTIGVDLKTLGANVNAGYGYSTTFGASTEIGGSLSMSATASTSATRMASAFEERIAGHEHVIDGGSITVSFDITNTGERAFVMEDFAMGVATYDRRDGRLVPLGTLTSPEGVSNVPVSPGETVTVLLRNTDLNGDRVRELLADPAALHFAAANYRLLDAEDVDFDWSLEQIFDRSATVMVDYGDGRVLRHHVAAGVGRDAEGRPLGVSVADILDDLGVSYSSLATDHGYVYTIDDVPTEFYPDAAPPFVGLDAPGYPVTGGPPLGRIKSAWFAFVHRRRPDAPELPADLTTVELLPGDFLSFTYSEDLDRDGLSAREEELRGTRDTSRDSDADGSLSDGLSDYWEAYEGWEVAVNGRDPVWVQSAPNRLDTDGDGLHDGREQQVGTHPERIDTDGDGLTDWYEMPGNHGDLSESLDPLRYNMLSAPVIECHYRSVTCYHRVYEDIDPGPGTRWERFDRPYTTLGVDFTVTDIAADVTEIGWEVRGPDWHDHIFGQAPLEERLTVDADPAPRTVWRWSDYHAYTATSGQAQVTYDGLVDPYRTTGAFEDCPRLQLIQSWEPWDRDPKTGPVPREPEPVTTADLHEIAISVRDASGNFVTKTCSFGGVE